MQFTGPLFIVGLPRSGTKLLRSLLNNHPEIGIPGAESQFLPYLYRRWAQFGDLSDSAKFHNFYAYATKLPYFVYMRQQGPGHASEGRMVWGMPTI